MFTITKNIDTTFRLMRGFCMILILANAATFCFYVYRCDQRVESAENKVLILLNGKVVSALNSNKKDNVEIEAKDHIEVFHHYFFTLDPDDKLIQNNITKALYMADGSAKRAYDNLRENGYYSNIIAGNISQRIAVDSITLNLESYPYSFRCYASQQLIRPTSTVSRSLITEGQFRNVLRSVNNPHGFLIERWATKENKDLKIENR